MRDAKEGEVKPDIREMPIDELRVVKVYRDLVPRPSQQDLALLRAEVKANGLDPARPLVVNEDLVVLDGHSRLEIAKDLGLEWVYVTVKDLGDHWAEREYVIKANLARRQLNTAQRAELGLKLLEIERERAKKRQQLAGKLYGRGQESPSQEEFLTKWVQSLQEQVARQAAVCAELIDGEKLDPNSEQPITCKQSQDGRALEIAAQQVGVGKDTLYRAEVIQQAAQEDPQIAAEWEDALAGKTTVNRVYRQARKVRIKDLPKHYGGGIGPGPFSLKIEPPPEPKPERVYSDEEKWQLLWMVADHYGVQRASLRHVMTTDKSAWFYWHQIVHDYMIPDIGWMFIMDRVKRYEQEQMAKLASERPLPEGAAALGPWALGHAHAVGLRELLEEFPPETAHFVFTDAQGSGPEEWSDLAAFGQRALVPGKWLAAYVSPAMLPAALEAMSAQGLQYRWTCALVRPRDQQYYDPETALVAVVNQWRMLLLFQKPGPSRQVEELRDVDDGEVFPLARPWLRGECWDAVLSNQRFVKHLPRQVVKACTLPGQLLVDPWVRDGGVLGMVARQTGRQYLLFHPDRGQAMAAEFFVSQDGPCDRGTLTQH